MAREEKLYDAMSAQELEALLVERRSFFSGFKKQMVRFLKQNDKFVKQQEKKARLEADFERNRQELKDRQKAPAKTRKEEFGFLGKYHTCSRFRLACGPSAMLFVLTYC